MHCKNNIVLGELGKDSSQPEEKIKGPDFVGCSTHGSRKCITLSLVVKKGSQFSEKTFVVSYPLANQTLIRRKT